MSKIYISGPMTGYDNLNRDKFSIAVNYLTEKDFIPIGSS